MSTRNALAKYLNAQGGTVPLACEGCGETDGIREMECERCEMVGCQYCLDPTCHTAEACDEHRREQAVRRSEQDHWDAVHRKIDEDIERKHKGRDEQ